VFEPGWLECRSLCVRLSSTNLDSRFRGMTVRLSSMELDSRFRGNDG